MPKVQKKRVQKSQSQSRPARRAPLRPSLKRKPALWLQYLWAMATSAEGPESRPFVDRDQLYDDVLERRIFHGLATRTVKPATRTTSDRSLFRLVVQGHVEIEASPDGIIVSKIPSQFRASQCLVEHLDKSRDLLGDTSEYSARETYYASCDALRMVYPREALFPAPKAHEVCFGLLSVNLANAQGGTPAPQVQQEVMNPASSAGPSGLASENVRMEVERTQSGTFNNLAAYPTPMTGPSHRPPAPLAPDASQSDFQTAPSSPLVEYRIRTLGSFDASVHALGSRPPEPMTPLAGPSTQQPTPGSSGTTDSDMTLCAKPLCIENREVAKIVTEEDGLMMTMIKENNLQNQPSSIPVLDELVRLRISWAPEMLQGAFEALQKQAVRLGPIMNRYKGSTSKLLDEDDAESDAIITTGSAS